MVFKRLKILSFSLYWGDGFCWELLSLKTIASSNKPTHQHNLTIAYNQAYTHTPIINNTH
ncbi:hypothetical protein BJI48_08235 [Helicobacter sp. 11S02596-1]|nr:hypothetical protein BJI48_08235 [Helicobacter sp. 11S02596-1]